MGPCKGCAQDVLRLLLANSSSLATSVHWHHRSMRANCKKTYVAWMGLCDGLHLRLFQANSRLSAILVHLHHGPMWAFLLAAIWLTEIYVGPCDILVQQPISCLMGQCMLIVKKPMLHEWAHVVACTWDLFRPTWGHRQHQCICIMGQCKHFSWQLSGWLKFIQAHATFSCGSPYCVWWANAC